MSFSISQAQHWQQEANYRMEVKLDDEAHFLHGRATINYVNHSPDTLQKVFLHLWPNAYSSKETPFARQKVENGDAEFYFAREENRGYLDSLDIQVNGEAVEVAYRDEHREMAKIALPEALSPNDSLRISTPFRVKIPKVFSRMGHEGQSYQISQWYPKVAKYDEEDWHPMPYLDQGEYYNDFGRYEVSINLPENYVVGATGKLQNEEEKQWLRKRDHLTRSGKLGRKYREKGTLPSAEERKTLHFVQEKVTDFAWFADKRYLVKMDTVRLDQTEGPITTYSLYKPGQAESYRNTPRYIGQALTALSEKVGPYPYSQYTVVNGALKAGGGMEYPTITVVSGNRPETTIFHEVTHSWFQEILAFNERRYPFLDEGLTTFYQNRYFRDWDGTFDQGDTEFGLMREGSGMEFLTKYLSHHQNRVAGDQAVNLPSTEFTELNYMAMVYGRTSWYWQYLFSYLGPEDFDRTMVAFYEEWAFRHPGPDALHEAFIKSTGDSLNWFFEGLLTQRAKPDYAVEEFKMNSEDQQGLKLVNKGKIEAPVLILLYKEDSVTGQRWIEGFEGKRQVVLEKRNWDKVTINPFPIIPGENYEDNVLHRKGLIKPVATQLLAGIDDPTKNQLFLTPFPAYNGADGLMAGALVTNSLFPPQPFEFALMPMHGFKSGRPGGMGEIRFNHYYQNEKRWGHFKFGVKGRRFSYETDPEVLSYFKAEPFISHEFQQKPLRTSPIHRFRLRSTWVNREYFGIKTLEPEFEDHVSREGYYVNELTYQYDNNDNLKPIEVEANLQQHKDFVKLFSSLEGKLPYGHKNQGFRWRLFGGYFFHNTGNLAGEYQFRLGNRLPALATDYTDPRDRQDYMYDRLLIDRGARSGLWSQQVYKNNGNFKIASAIGSNSEWLLSANLMTSLPGQTPLRLFADIGTYPDADEVFDNTISYDAGPALVLWEDVLEVYYPVLYSQEFESVLENRGVSEWEKIQFVLNLNPENLLDLRHKLDEVF